MASIIKEILKHLPEGAISNAIYEGANIVLYTKDKNFLVEGIDEIKKVVDIFKKRIELRADPSILMPPERAKKKILEIIPSEANVGEINFDPERSIVIIEAEKPGVAIGKQGSVLKEIKKKTFWTAQIKRKPPIRSEIIENIEAVIYESGDEIKKFLHKVGERIYNGWIRGRKYEWVRVGFLGGAGQVGRSCILLQTQESRVLIDVGIDVSRDDINAFPILSVPEFNLNEIDAVIVSHAHMDHSGFVPALFRYGYRGPVYVTAPTRDVMTLLQLDYIKIMMQSGKEPMYNADDIKEMLKHTIVLDYDEVTDITPDVRITFHNAGHILGSAMVHIHIGNGLHNLLYTGDLKFIRTELLDPAITKFQRLESLIIESTYGGKNDILPRREEAEEELIKIIENTIERGGKVLIPVLGVGRAQEVMLIIEKAISSGRLKKIPVYIDGMVWDITAIHTAYPDFLSKRVRNRIYNSNNPFLADFFKRVGSNKEREMVIEKNEPCVIVATSGMLTGGASVQYLKELGENPNNSLIFVSYLAEGTLGRRIISGEREFSFKENGNIRHVKINLEVHHVHGLSGHADRKELGRFLKYLTPKPKKIIVVHGEKSKSKELKSFFENRFRIETIVPKNLEIVRLV